MSKIGKMPIIVKDGITVAITGQNVNIHGPKGEGMYTVPQSLEVLFQEGKLAVKQKQTNDPETRALFGLTRANLANIVKGVDINFEKKLELSGVGYRALMQGSDLVLSLGYSHPVKFKTPTGITISVSENVISISGMDKALVGQVAAKIRDIKAPEPYKGKGIKYKGEQIRRKAGKAAKAVGVK